MINLISTQARSRDPYGPTKVFRNLVKGLDLIGYPYVVNRGLDSVERLWVHDDIRALGPASRVSADTVIGPNLYVLPDEIPSAVDLSTMLYVHPCSWSIDVWHFLGFDRCDLAVWPVGIDVDEFRPHPRSARSQDVLVYHKDRPEEGLQQVLRSLESSGLRYRLLRYGAYVEAEYKEALSYSGLVVWHGRHESQGIAYLEALASGVPILVCDVSRLSQSVSSAFAAELDAVPVTSTPYFDESCGIRTIELEGVGQLARDMLSARDRFSPRAFVETHLSLEGQARAFVDLWSRWPPGPSTSEPRGAWPTREVQARELITRATRKARHLRGRSGHAISRVFRRS